MIKEEGMINSTFLILQVVNIGLMVLWVALVIRALMRLRHCELNETQRLAWTALIVFVPVLGAVAFWLVRPGDNRQGSRAA